MWSDFPITLFLVGLFPALGFLCQGRYFREKGLCFVGFFFMVESSHGSGMVRCLFRSETCRLLWILSVVHAFFNTPVVVGDFLNLSGVFGLWNILGQHFRIFIVKVEQFIGEKYILRICHWLIERALLMGIFERFIFISDEVTQT